MLSRRDLVGKIAAGAAGAVVLAASRGSANAAVNTSVSDSPDHRDGVIDQTPSAAAPPEENSSVEATNDVPCAPAEPAPWELLQPLALGAVVANGWRLADLSGPAGGAWVLTLQNERGRVQRIHLCRNAGKPQGLVYTSRFDLVVMNGGQGDLGTEENLAQAVAALAHVIAANEDAGNHRVAASLLPHAERLRQFADASEWTLR